MGCRAGKVYRALSYGKDFFAVCRRDDAWHPTTHGKDLEKHTAKNNAWQRGRKTHGKEKKHGNNPSKRTTKRRSTVKEALRYRGTHFAVRHEGLHGKAPFVVRHATKHGKSAFAVRCLLCRVQISFLSSFLSILFFLILIFFSISFIFY
jgi:hypothetical protein